MAIHDDILMVGGDYASSLVGIRNTARGVTGILDKITSGNPTSTPGAVRDLFTNGFLAQKSMFVPEFFARAFDEPTYLTFRIEFITDPNDADAALRNNAYNNNGPMGAAQANIAFGKMYDYMPEPFLSGYNKLEFSGDTSIGKSYSSEAYLDLALGDHGRAQLLHTFKLALNDIQKNFPYYFKGISGLSSLTKVDPKNGARLKDAKITIDCYEGLDLKITQLLNLYRKIVWDDVYQRWVLPDMMRYFGIRIYISEIRLFQDRKRKSAAAPLTYNFDYSDTRNATAYPLDSDEKSTMGNGLKNAVAVSNTFLGTKSLISRALNYTEGTISTVGEIFNTVNNALNDIEYCNNAINDVMPTICLECHMCEFDIEDSMNYLDSLSSSTKGNEGVNPKLTIKIGQLTESHSYPLNATLGRKLANDGDSLFDYYMTTIRERKDASSGTYVSANINSFNDLFEERNNKLKFAGNFISDRALNVNHTSPTLNDRIERYIERLSHEMGDVGAATINQKRLPSELINKKGEMSYSRNTMTQSLAQAGLTSALMNEAVSLARRANVNSEIVGTDSLALNQQNYLKKSVEAVGDALNEIADRVYNGEEINSMALSEQMKNKVATDMFNEIINNLEQSTATSKDSILHEFLKNYKVLQNEE